MMYIRENDGYTVKTRKGFRMADGKTVIELRPEGLTLRGEEGELRRVVPPKKKS